jgi:hypothetical protein
LLDPDTDELYVDTPAQRSALLALRGRSSIVPTKCPDYKFPLVYRHRVDVPDFDTVLSPAVKLVRPKFLAGLSLGDNVGRVEFDPTMDTTVNAATVVSVVGCGATIERDCLFNGFDLRKRLSPSAPRRAPRRTGCSPSPVPTRSVPCHRVPSGQRLRSAASHRVSSCTSPYYCVL